MQKNQQKDIMVIIEESLMPLWSEGCPIIRHNEIHDTVLDITKCPLTLILNKLVNSFVSHEEQDTLWHFVMSIVKYHESHYVGVLEMYALELESM